jgi:FtsZ-interacting cell division protein ZipA
VEAELVALATAGATALVQQMVTDTWTSVRERAVSFFSRGSTTPESVAADLDTARAELVDAQRSADAETAADIQAEWRVRMRRTLRADPEAAAELRALLDELSPGETAPQRLDVHNTISGGTQHGPVIQSGTIGNIHFGNQRG